MSQVAYRIACSKNQQTRFQGLEMDCIQPAFMSPDPSAHVYGKNLVLDAHENLLFLGPSGRGKSTLFRIFLGLPVSGSGSVCYTLETMQGMSTSLELEDLRALHVSAIPQDFRLIPHISLRDNINLGQSAWLRANTYNGTSTKSLPDLTTILAYAKVLEIQGKLDQKVSKLSRGEQQRGAILRALSRPFDLLIADEAFSHLDEERELKALDLMLEVSQNQDAGIWLMDLGSTPGLDLLENQIKSSLRPGFREIWL